MKFKHKNPDVTQVTVGGFEMNFIDGIFETENPAIISILRDSKEVEPYKEPKKVTKDN